MTASPHMRGLVELDGEASDIQALRTVAPACNCTIEPGPDAKLGWLGGTKFDSATTPEKALEEASKILVLLNGLARLENSQHRNVGLGDAFSQNGRIHYFRPPQTRPPRSTIHIFESPLTGGRFVPPANPADARRRASIVADPKLVEIVEAFADEITWQRLRVAFEKINALVGKGDNALVKHGYATQEELTRFKANVEDPRHSGVNAVHGVPRGPPKGTKMTEKEGFDFVTRLINTYLAELAEHPNKTR